MVEYVYAIHDFIPENDDEVPFRAGERIEIVERDDLYGDGWWQGRNLAGRVGLFPQNYTQPAPTVTPTPPEPVSQGPEHSSSTPAEEPHPLEPSTSAALLPLMEEPEPSQSTGKATPKGEVMRATLTDVQKAIEQLGERTDADGARSFSFSSVRDGDTTDHDTGEDSDAQEGDDWYKATRQKLAERAREQVEEARAREVVGNRASIPPIDVDISDESGDEEEDGTRKLNSHRSHPHIPEEDEEAEGKSQSASSPKRGSSPEVSPAVEASDQFIVPSPLDALPDLPTATQMTFPPSDKPAIPDTESASPSHFSHTTALLRPSDILLNPDLPKPSESIDSSTQMPNYAGKDVGPTSTTTPLASPAPSSHMHVASSTSTSSSTKFVASSPLSQSQTFQDSMMSPSSSALKRPGSHPTDWTVEEVVDWLKSRGFDDSVCDKFTEQEITGDVLLELDVNVLKSEIGIIAFGKRMRIANAIADLRRPPSVMSENPPLSASLLASSPGPGTSSPFRSHSQSQSVVTATTHHSSPYTPTSMQRQFTGQNGEAGDIQGRPRRDSDPGIVADSQATLGTAVDLVSSRNGKARPSQLTLSPSDSALGSSVKAISGDISGSADLERGSEAVADSRLRKSPTKGAKSQSSRTDPGEGADGSSPTQHARKRSTDTSKPPSDRDRHSLFGGAFTSTLGRSRKPPPRYSGAEAESPEKGGLSFSRLVPGGSRKSSGRPQTADGTASATTLTVVRDSGAGKRDSRDSGNSKERKDPALLRKRTSSAAGSPVSRDSPVANSLVRDRAGAAAATLKAGQSILQQIGAPDHNGWMRKKGERYNAWKNRYFVLKGPHLYWLRSNSPTEIRIKGYVNTTGYRIIADEKIDPGKYGFKLIHETEKSHLFSSDEQSVIREWMKALMKAAIDRDYTKPVISSVNIPTIPLAVAQAMNPAPRPPSPTARAATQKALRRENTNQLSTRDAQVLMGSLPSVENGERTRLESVFSSDTAASVASINSGMSLEDSAYVSAADASKSAPPSRPSRELRRLASTSTQPDITLDPILAEWVNSHVPRTLQLLGSSSGPLCIGLTLLRLAESIKGSPASPPVSDAAFPSNPNDDKLEGLFRLFDFLLDNDVRMGSVSINDIRQGRRDKVIQLLKALRSWEDKRRALTRSIGKGGMTAGGFVASVGWDE